MWLTDFVAASGEPLQVTCKLSGNAARNTGTNLTTVPTPSCAQVGDYQVVVWQYFGNGTPIWDYNDWGPAVGQWKSSVFQPQNSTEACLSFRKITAENISVPFAIQQTSGALNIRYGTFIVKGSIKDFDPITAVAISGASGLNASGSSAGVDSRRPEMPAYLPLTEVGDLVIASGAQTTNNSGVPVVVPAEVPGLILASDCTQQYLAAAAVSNIAYVAQLLDGTTYSNMNGDGLPLAGWTFSRMARNTGQENYATEYSLYEQALGAGARYGMYKDFYLTAGTKYVFVVDMANVGSSGTGVGTSSPWVTVTPPTAAEFGAAGNGQVNSFLGFGGMTADNYIRRRYSNNSFGGYTYVSGLWFVAPETGVHRIWCGLIRQDEIATFPGSLLTHSGSTSRGFRGNFVSLSATGPDSLFEAAPYAGIQERNNPTYESATNRYRIFCPARHPNAINRWTVSVFRSGVAKRPKNYVRLLNHVHLIPNLKQDNGRHILNTPAGNLNWEGETFIRQTPEIVGMWLGSKFYFELVVEATSVYYAAGYVYSGMALTYWSGAFPGTGSNGYFAGAGPTRLYNYNSTLNSQPDWAVGDVIGFLLDLSNSNDVRVRVTKNGVSFGDAQLPSGKIWWQTGVRAFVVDTMNGEENQAAKYTVNLTGPFYYKPVDAIPFDFDNEVGALTGVAALLHFNGADGSTTLIEQTGKTATAVGTAQLDDTQSMFGGTSLLLNGSGYVTIPASTDFGFGTGDFTVEMFVRRSANVSFARLFAIGAYGTPFNFQIEDNNGLLNIHINGSFVGIGTGTTLGAWQHLAVTRQGGVVRVFVGGVQTSYGNWTNAGAIHCAGVVAIGAQPAGTEQFQGHIDELRVVKGTALYTANFTPPVAPFPDP